MGEDRERVGWSASPSTFLSLREKLQAQHDMLQKQSRKINLSSSITTQIYMTKNLIKPIGAEGKGGDDRRRLQQIQHTGQLVFV
jgi:hypothetical protein